jgi:hypothetical protein
VRRTCTASPAQLGEALSTCKRTLSTSKGQITIDVHTPVAPPSANSVPNENRASGAMPDAEAS